MSAASIAPWADARAQQRGHPSPDAPVDAAVGHRAEEAEDGDPHLRQPRVVAVRLEEGHLEHLNARLRFATWAQQTDIQGWEGSRGSEMEITTNLIENG